MAGRLISRSQQRRQGWLRVAALTLVTFASGLIGFVDSTPTDAAISTLGGACGFHLGAPLVTGAAGTAGLVSRSVLDG